MSRFISLSTALILMLGLLPAQAQQAESKADKSTPPTWKPDAAQLAKLGDEYAGDKWSIRPVKGTRPSKRGNSAEKRTIWTVFEGNNLAGTLILGDLQNPVPQGQSLEAGLASALDAQKQRLKNYQQFATEEGLIDGRRFRRVRFSGEGVPFMPGVSYGFIYLTYDRDRPMMFTGFARGDTIEAIEASVQTIRLK